MATLSFNPDARRYDHNHEESLYTRLTELDQQSVLCPISSERELLLDTKGYTVAGGYRLTEWALFQLCHNVCGGLYRVLQDLSGPVGSATSFTVALETLNRVVRLRFADRLYGRQILCDEGTKTVEGIVGPKYKWLSNKLLYERVRATIPGGKDSARFCGAVLCGRWMLLRYYHKKRYFESTGPDGESHPYYRGYHFSNHEIGHASIRAAAIILSGRDVTAAMSPITAANRVRHHGRHFDRKLNRLIGNVTLKIEPAQEYCDHIKNLQATDLGLGDPQYRSERMNAVVERLARFRVGVGWSRRVVTMAALQGEAGPPRSNLLLMTDKDWESRTVFDLYNALGREAKNMPIGARERAEQAAYALLTRRIILD